MVLAINRKPVTCFNDVETKLVFTIFRQGREMENQLLTWMLLSEVLLMVSRFVSPVHKYGLYCQQWIVEVNGKPTLDLDAFVNATKEIEHGEFVRVRTVQLNGKPRVLTLKQDLHYWPTRELRFDPETATWHRRIIKSLETRDSL
ncbi:putative PDZ superfamily protein [Helianthus debilis subsp. tardiflorus]